MYVRFWELRISWDDLMSKKILKEFVELCQELPKVHSISIPRWLGLGAQGTAKS